MLSTQTLTRRRLRNSLPARRAVCVVIVGTLALSGAVALSTPAQAAVPRAASFGYTGSEQSYVVPASATSLRMHVVGAPGAAGGGTHCGYYANPNHSGSCPAAAGGAGAVVDAVFPVCAACSVQPGQTLYVEVGGVGQAGSADDSVGPSAGGYNGGGRSLRGSGGGGGGASDVQSSAGLAATSSRLAVAGGGGGGGSDGNSCGAEGFSEPGGAGGAGGDTAGNAGGSGADEYCYTGPKGGGGGRGGSRTGAGAGGVPGPVSNICNIADPGTAGSGAQGGDGGWEANFTGGRVPAVGGGGGGGGYFGGGGGSGGSTCGAYDTLGAGGGGGGSSYYGSAPATVGTDTTATPMVTLTVTSTAATTLNCAQSITVIGNPVSCTATVSDADSNPVTPTGSVAFTSTGAGTFSAPSCTLSSGSCAVSFTPSGNAGNTDTVTAKYGGDSYHVVGAAGTAQLAVGKRATGTSASCTTATVGQTSTCTAVVLDTDTGTATAPTGVVTWSGSGGSFNASTCTLIASTCSVKFTPSAPGSPQLTVSYGGDSTHAASSKAITLTVGQGAGSVSIANLPSSAAFAGTFTPTFTQVGDGVPSVASSTPSVCAVQNGVVTFVAPGSCSLQASVPQTTNYTAATGPVQTFTVSKAAATISISNLPSSGTFGGTFTPMFTYSGDGVPSVASSTASVCAVAAGVVSYVGPGSCQLQASATAGDDYAAVAGSTQSFTVSKAAATISISNLPSSGTYGGTFTPTFTQSGDGVASVASLTPSVCATDAGVVSYQAPGVCKLQASAAASDDYTAVTGDPQTFTIVKAPAAISISNVPSPAVLGDHFTPTFTQVGDGATSVTSLTPTTCAVKAGVVSFAAVGSCQLQAEAAASADYTAVTGDTQTFTVYGPPTVTAAPTNQTVVARESVTFSASATSDSPTTVRWQVSTDGGLTWTDVPDSTDATLTFVTSAALSGDQYRAVFTSAGGSTATAAATLTVTKIPLTVTASSPIVTYGDPTPIVAPLYSSFAAGDDIATAVLTAPTCTTAEQPSSPAGSVPTACSGGSFAADYAVTYVPGAVTVNPATVVVTAQDAQRTYGDANPSFGYALTGFVNGDTASVVSGEPVIYTDAGVDSAVGTYPISVGLGTLAAANYTFTFRPAAFTITPAPLTITASNARQIFGARVAAPITPSYSGFVAGDTAASLTTRPTCRSWVTQTDHPGRYLSSCSQAVDVNYNISYVTGTVTVTPAAQTITSTTVVPRHPVVGSKIQMTAKPGASRSAISYSTGVSTQRGACTVSGRGLVHLTGLGRCVVALHEPTSQDYSATTLQIVIHVDTAPPTWSTGRQLPSERVGRSYSRSLTSIATPAPTLRVTAGHLPPGLRLTHDRRLVGTPSRAGRYTFTLTATNRGGRRSRTFTITIHKK